MAFRLLFWISQYKNDILMPKYLVDLPEHLYNDLKGLSEGTGVSMAFHMRQALTGYLTNQNQCTLMVSGSMVSGCVYVFRSL